MLQLHGIPDWIAPAGACPSRGATPAATEFPDLRLQYLNAAQRQALAEKVERGPVPAVDGVVRWRLKDLVQWIFEDFGISLDETTVGRELKTMGFRKLSARPRHYAQNGKAIEDFKKAFPPRWQRCGPPCRPEPT